MYVRSAILLATIFATCFPNGGVALADSEHRKALTYEQHVRPIFKVACFHCHGEQDELAGGLDLRLVRLMSGGGESGPAIVSGDLHSSLLWERIVNDEMPEGSKKLTSAQKETIRRWIEQGAKTARPEPDDVEDARFTLEELNHWAFHPVVRPKIPKIDSGTVATPVDAFIAAKLRDAGLSFAPPADRRTLIRRVTFDLTGLPPTPDEVNRFVRDTGPGAFARLVDRLLASPEYGIRWGRHWLDVAGYAESNGGPTADRRRRHAWRYRDYVVDSFNAGKPINQFLMEQLAGDELVHPDSHRLSPQRQELLTATGFLRMAPDPTQDSNSIADRNMAVADAINVISTATFGLTVGCAQCHDHKYDPIGIDDYYRFRAIFDPVFPLQNWKQPTARLVDVTPKDVRDERDRIEAKAKMLEEDMEKRREAVCQRIQDAKLEDVPEEVRAETRTAVLTQPGKRTQRQQELLDQYPMVKPLGTIRGLLVEYDSKSYRAFEKEQAEIAKVRAAMPPPRLIMATTETPNVIPTSMVFFRGNPESPKEEVSPSELMVLSRHGREVKIPHNIAGRSTTGRRLAFARSLTDGSHPLTARVFVNRVWMHHLGRGLVDTPSDFGLMGGKPTHPKLLDWLADDFVRNGWDQKRLHRLILLSTTYRQSSKRTRKKDAIDPDNGLFGRMNLRRLSAEEIRDAILATSNQINWLHHGPSAPVTEDAEGKTVIGKRLIKDGLKAGVDHANSDAFRRSIYVETQRRLPLSFLATFDQPVMNPNCSVRRPSTVATQSLWFLNDEFVVQLSEHLAKSILETEQSIDDRHICRLFERLFSKLPAEDELAMCWDFIRDQQADPADSKASDQQQIRSFATLCQTLLASNQFLYVD